VKEEKQIFVRDAFVSEPPIRTTCAFIVQQSTVSSSINVTCVIAVSNKNLDRIFMYSSDIRKQPRWQSTINTSFCSNIDLNSFVYYCRVLHQLGRWRVFDKDVPVERSEQVFRLGLDLYMIIIISTCKWTNSLNIDHLHSRLCSSTKYVIRV
jgi:hypothetical protein